MGLKLKNRKVLCVCINTHVCAHVFSNPLRFTVRGISSQVAESKLAKFVEDIIVPPRMIDIIVDGEVVSLCFCSLLLFNILFFGFLFSLLFIAKYLFVYLLFHFKFPYR